MAQTLAQLAARINALDNAESAYFNEHCLSKIYDGRLVDLVDPEKSDIEDMASDVDSLVAADVIELNNYLNARRKLSERPC